MFEKLKGARGQKVGARDQDADELVSMGQTAMHADDTAGALQFFEQALAQNPRHETAMSFKALVLRALGRLPESMASFDRLLQQNPRSALGWFGKGMLVMEMNHRYDEALGYLEKAQSLGYRGAAEAIDICKQALAAKPKRKSSSSPEAEELIEKGKRLAEEFRWQETLACAERALKLDAKADRAWALKGAALSGLERSREAHAAFDQAIAVNPLSEDAWFEKGIEHREAGENEQAITCYDKVIEFNPNSKSAWFNKGAVYLVGLQRYPEALECYQKAETLGVKEATPVIAKIKDMMSSTGEASIHSEQSRQWYHKGIKLAEVGRVEEATEFFERAVKMSPMFAEAWYASGRAALTLGNFEDAVKYFDRVIQIEPEMGSAWKEKASALSSLERYGEAIALLDHFLEVNPDDANGWINKGIVFFNADRVDEARPCFQKAKQLGHPRGDDYLTRCDEAAQSPAELTPARRNFQLAYEAFKVARSADEMRAATAKYRWMATPDFVEQLIENLERRESDYAKGAYEDRLRWLREVPPDPLHLALEAFNGAGSFEDMQRAVDKFPLMTSPDYLQQLQLLLANQVEEKDKPMFRQRLSWLSQIETDPFQAALNAFGAADSQALMEKAVAKFPVLTSRNSITTIERMSASSRSPEESREMERRIAWLKQLPPPETDQNYEQACDLFGDERYEEALELLDRVLAIDPKLPRALLMRGLVFMALDEDEEALRDLTSYIRMRPDKALAYERRGKANFKLHRYSEAIEDFSRALELDPEDTESYHGRGNSFLSLEQFEDACDDFTSAIEYGGTDVMSYFARGMANTMLQRFDDALADFESVMEVLPNHEPALMNKGVVLMQMGRRQEARECFEEVLEANPSAPSARDFLEMVAGDRNVRGGSASAPQSGEDPRNWYYLGNQKIDEGDYHEAVANYRLAVMLDPTFVGAWANMGAALVQLGELDEALSCFNEASELEPDDASIWLNKGAVLEKQGNFTEALACITTAQQLDDQDANGWYNKGVILYRLSNAKEALTCFKRALALAPDFGPALQWRDHVTKELGSL